MTTAFDTETFAGLPSGTWEDKGAAASSWSEAL